MRHFLLAASAASFLHLPAAAETITEQSVRGARAICIMMDAPKLLTQPCEYSIWGASITAVMPVSVDESRQICDILRDSIEANGLVFEDGWQMNIRHPFSGENNIATCPLG